jgi:precorrin-3B synthase
MPMTRGCASPLVPVRHRAVRDDATHWAALLPKADGVILHVSGCAKGCARAARTAATLTATAEGYDLVLGGRAGDLPVRRSLASAEVARLLASEGANPFSGVGLT